MRHIFLQLFFLSVSANLYAGTPPLFSDYQIKAELLSHYYTTKHNFYESGSYEPLLNSQSFMAWSNELKAQYILSPKWLVGAKGNLIYAKSTGQFEDRETTRIDHFKAHGAYLFKVMGFNIIPFSELTVTLNSIDLNTDEVLTGEGVNAFEVGSWATYPINKLEPFLYLGLRFQDDDRAHLALWKAGLKASFGSFFATGKFNGYFPFSDDKYKDNVFIRQAVTNRVNGSSLRYYSTNPEIMEVEVEGGYSHHSGWQISGGLNQTLNGKNTAYGTGLFARLTWGLNPIANNELESEIIDLKKHNQPRRRRQQQFQPRLEEYDESLFQ